MTVPRDKPLILHGGAGWGDYLFYAAIVLSLTATFSALILYSFAPHTLGHAWGWTGGEDFHADYGECRSQSLLGGFGSPNVDSATLQSLMRARGWTQQCMTCGEWRWAEGAEEG